MIRLRHAAGRNPDFPVPSGCAHVQTGRPVHAQGIEVAGVDLNDAGAGFPGKGKLFRAEDFHHGLHAETLRQFAQPAQTPNVGCKTDNQQQGRGWRGRREPHLKRVQDEILAQQRKPRRGHTGKKAGFSPETGAFRQYGKTGRSGRGIASGHIFRGKIEPDISPGGGSPLVFRDDRQDAAARGRESGAEGGARSGQGNRELSFPLQTDQGTDFLLLFRPEGVQHSARRCVGRSAGGA